MKKELPFIGAIICILLNTFNIIPFWMIIILFCIFGVVLVFWDWIVKSISDAFERDYWYQTIKRDFKSLFVICRDWLRILENQILTFSIVLITLPLLLLHDCTLFTGTITVIVWIFGIILVTFLTKYLKSVK